MKTITLYIAVLFIMVITGGASCCNEDTAHTNKPVIVTHTTLYVVDRIGRIVIDVKCPKGEQMIGGGYRVPRFQMNLSHLKKESDRSPEDIFNGTNAWTEDATECDKNQQPLVVEASYPSALDTWTVIIYNPDVQANCFHAGDVIEVDCYAVTNKNLNLRMKIDSVGPHPTNISGAPPMLKDTCNCPDNSVITAGGYKMVPLDETKAPNGYYTPLWGSYPNTLPNNKAIGWASEFSTTVSQPEMITTYVLCSTTGRKLIPISLDPNSNPLMGGLIPSALEDGPVKAESVTQVDGVGVRQGMVLCDKDYFSSGGGFRIVYRGSQAPFLAIPHSVGIESGASGVVNGNWIPYAGWTTHFWAAYNTSNYQWATTEDDTIYTVQIKNLQKNIEVGITSPSNRDCFPPDSIRSEYSGPLTFKGYAFDHDGSVISGNNLKWEITGSADGNGENFTTKIKLSDGKIDSYTQTYFYTVRLTATGKNGDSESAFIILYQCIVVL